MTRFASSDNEDASELPHVPYVMFADFDFPSGNVRLNSAAMEYSFGGNTYTPAGKLAGIGPVKESADLSPEKLEFTLSGVDNSLILTALGEKYHGRSAKLYVGYLNSDGALVADPHLLWEGRMDVMAIRTETGGSIISLVCENRLVLWNRASNWLYSHDHQRILFSSSTDNFLNQVETLTDKLAKWGDQSVNPPPKQSWNDWIRENGVGGLG